MTELNRFKEGESYYIFLGLDNNSKIPAILSFVFVGMNLENNISSEDMWYFQDEKSYFNCFFYDGFNKLLFENPLINNSCLSKIKFEKIDIDLNYIYITDMNNHGCDIYPFSKDDLISIVTLRELIKILDGYGYDKNRVKLLLKDPIGHKYLINQCQELTD